jgi:polar amino acid transport system ATP-binding protein/sulfate transport system ATP-binding protein
MERRYCFKETLLTLDRVSLEIGGRAILSDLSAVIRNVTRPGVQQGQVVGILGASGVGKTQLCRIISGLMPPSSGSVLVGREQTPVSAGRVGFVAQDYPLFWHKSVLENLGLAGRLAGDSSDVAESRARELLSRFGLEARANDFPALLSGGERQRVAILQQILRKSSLLLLDEPFSGLDLCMLERVSKLVREISQRDELLTILIVSHDISALLSVADTIWVLGKPASADRSAGARFVQIVDLMERGIAWSENASAAPAYADTRRELECRMLAA